MIQTMHGILQKHADDNKMLAEQLVAFKQQIMDADSFNSSNRKFHGFRYTSFGRYPAVLYFSEHQSPDSANDKEYYLNMEYGSGKAFKIPLNTLEEFYIVEGTNQLQFVWPEKGMFKKHRTETFESDLNEDVLEKYLDVKKMMEE